MLQVDVVSGILLPTWQARGGEREAHFHRKRFAQLRTICAFRHTLQLYTAMDVVT